MISLLTRCLFLSIALIAISGCKVAVVVVEGGEVDSINSGVCVEGAICIVEVSGPFFSDTFIAVPKPGWKFVKWNSGWGFLCDDSTNAECVISTVGTFDNTLIRSIIASDTSYYLMPVFRRVVSNSKTIAVGEREWYQADLFDDLSWNDIEARCPEASCSGWLKGHNMNGWTWASVDEVKLLFNTYIGFRALGPDDDYYGGPSDSDWGSEFFEDGWRPTVDSPVLRLTGGWVSDKWNAEQALTMRLLDVFPNGGFFGGDEASISGSHAVNLKLSGGWFFRPL